MNSSLSSDNVFCIFIALAAWTSAMFFGYFLGAVTSGYFVQYLGFRVASSIFLGLQILVFTFDVFEMSFISFQKTKRNKDSITYL